MNAIDRPAPPLQVDRWFNTSLPLSLDALRGTVIVLGVPSAIIGGALLMNGARFIRNDLSLNVEELLEEQDEHRNRRDPERQDRAGTELVGLETDRRQNQRHEAAGDEDDGASEEQLRPPPLADLPDDVDQLLPLSPAAERFRHEDLRLPTGVISPAFRPSYRVYYLELNIR